VAFLPLHKIGGRSVSRYDELIVTAFNCKDNSKTVPLSDLEYTENSDVNEATTNGSISADVLNINDFQRSHLVGNDPPLDFWRIIGYHSHGRARWGASGALYP